MVRKNQLLFSLLILGILVSGSFQQTCNAAQTEKCLTCVVGDITKCEVCKDGNFKEMDSCTSCSTGCSKCSASNICSECASTHDKILDACFVKCKSNEFRHTDNTCQACDATCLTCKTTAQMCQSCAEGKDKIGDACFDKCKSNEFRHTDNSCQACDATCLTCMTTATKCLTCAEGKDKIGDACVEKCPSGQFRFTDKTCKACDSNCKECSESATTCTFCHNNILLNKDTKMCYCQEGKFLDSSSKSCLDCVSGGNCKTCENSLVCLTCIDGQFKQNGKCVATCSEGYFKKDLLTCEKCSDDNCQSCGTDKKCTTCKSDFNLMNDKSCCLKQQFRQVDKCVVQCEEGFFLLKEKNLCTKTCGENNWPFYNPVEAGQKECMPCPQGCLTCSTAKNCTLCNAGYDKSEESREGGQPNYSCLALCKPETETSTNPVFHKGCVECSPSNITHPSFTCLKCKPAFQLISGACTVCQLNQGVQQNTTTVNGTEVVSNICKKCKDENCKTCQTVNANFTGELSICNTCMDGFFKDAVGACKPCPKGCKTCSDPTGGETVGKCLTCKEPTEGIFTKNECEQINCSDSETYDFDQKKCITCEKDCLICGLNKQDACRVCKNNQVPINKICTDLIDEKSQEIICPLGAIAIRGIQKCYCTDVRMFYNDETKQCEQLKSNKNDTNCLLCYVVSENGCPKSATQGGCQQFCRVQRDANSDQCMECKKVLSYDLEGNGGTVNTDLSLYLDSNKKCQQCRKDCLKCDDLKTCHQCSLSTLMVYNEEESFCVSQCPTGYLPSVPSMVLFPTNIPEINTIRDNILAQDDAQIELNKDLSQNAVAVGLNGEPLLEETDKRKIQFVMENGTIKFRLPTLQLSSEITMLCTPCLFNCQTCAEGYFRLEDEKRCFARCPKGYMANKSTKLCEKITGAQVSIKSGQISEQDGFFILKNELKLEAIVALEEGKTERPAYTYKWTITPTSSKFNSLLQTATNANPNFASLTTRAVVIKTGNNPSSDTFKFYTEVVYTIKVEVTFEGKTTSFSRTVQPLTKAITLETLPIFPRQIMLDKINVDTTTYTQKLTYFLFNVEKFQTAEWIYQISTENGEIPAQTSKQNRGSFTFVVPILNIYREYRLKFSVSNGIVTYYTFRTFSVDGKNNETAVKDALKQKIEALVSSTENENILSEYLDVAGLFKQVAALAVSIPNVDERKKKDDYLGSVENLMSGFCKVNSDCFDGTCVDVNKTNDEDKQRKYCKCTSDSVVGQFCEYKKDLIMDAWKNTKPLLEKLLSPVNTFQIPNEVNTIQAISQILAETINYLSVENLNAYLDLFLASITNLRTLNQKLLPNRGEGLLNRLNMFLLTDPKIKMLSASELSAIQKKIILIESIRRPRTLKALQDFQKTTFQLQPSLTGDFSYVFLETKDLLTKLNNPANLPLAIRDQNILLQFSLDVTKNAQTALSVLGVQDKSFYRFVQSINNTVAPLLKISFLNLDNDEVAEINADFPDKAPITNITFKGVSHQNSDEFQLTCAYLDEEKQVFKLRTESRCETVLVNKISKTETDVQCQCTHNSIFTVVEYKKLRKNIDTPQNARNIYNSLILLFAIFLSTFI